MSRGKPIGSGTDVSATLPPEQILRRSAPQDDSRGLASEDGDTRTPTRINLFIFELWEIPLAYVLAHRLGMGPRGVFMAIPIAFSTLAVVSTLLFRRGR